MKRKILSIGLFLFLNLLTSAWAADILGNWIAKVQGTQSMNISAPTLLGKTGFTLLGETVFSFKANGTELTGKVSDPQGETPIREGRIHGDKISFVVIRSVGGKERRLAYKGQVSLNEIRFTLEVQGLKGQPQEFIAKREFQRHNDYIPSRIAIDAPPYSGGGVVPVEPPPPPNK